ncbi:MAG TPA: CopG family transcriptional regulator [Candidatus Acidoferrales bacterium]|nr:CopG family transcriptional regulator [Candidatus Acidoferrales bacterium]
MGIAENVRDKIVVFHRIHRYGELWCDGILPASEIPNVTRGAKRKEKPKPTEVSSVRATISFPAEIYQTLENIAGEKKVSLAWVVREAAEQYIENKWPLFKGKV